MIKYAGKYRQVIYFIADVFGIMIPWRWVRMMSDCLAVVKCNRSPAVCRVSRVMCRASRVILFYHGVHGV